MDVIFAFGGLHSFRRFPRRVCGCVRDDVIREKRQDVEDEGSYIVDFIKICTAYRTEKDIIAFYVY